MFALPILAVPAEIKANGAFNIRRLGMAALGLDWPKPLEFLYPCYIRASVGIKALNFCTIIGNAIVENGQNNCSVYSAAISRAYGCSPQATEMNKKEQP